MRKSKITDNCRSILTADLDCISRFKEIRNQNSLAFKFDELRKLVTGICDILIMTEIKLNDTFPLSQFHTDGF